MTAGRRRKSKKTRRTSRRKLRGGNGYGAEFSGANSIGVGAMPWTANMTSVPGGAPTTIGGRRRRKSRKTRKMRGGMSVAGSGAAFTGEGAARGMGGFQGYSTGGPMNVVALPQ
jgi:hypothetical protein